MSSHWREALPYLFYVAGSLCFLIGSFITLARMVRWW